MNLDADSKNAHNVLWNQLPFQAKLGDMYTELGSRHCPGRIDS